MKQKKPYIKVNLDTENPLRTILKAGKIPVIRRNKDGFRNYNQSDFIENQKSHIEENINISGCFCLLGGIFGNWSTGDHFNEALNIGFIEPDTPVFATYSYNKDLSWKFISAKERYVDASQSFTVNFNSGNVSGYKLEDFETYEEAIIDAKYITKVCTIPFSDYYKLVRYSHDGMITLFTEEHLLSAVINNLPVAFLRKYNVETNDDFRDLLSGKDPDGFPYNYLDLYKSLQKSIINDLKAFVTDKDKTVAEHALQYIKAIRSCPFYSSERSYVYRPDKYFITNDMDIRKHLFSVFPLLETKGESYMSATVNDRFFTLEIRPIWYLVEWFHLPGFYDSNIFIFDYHVDTGKLFIKSENFVKEPKYYDLSQGLSGYIQLLLLLFTETFRIYMEHFSKFFHIQPFDKYYHMIYIVDAIKELQKHGIKWKLSPDMSVLVFTLKDGTLVEHNIVLQDAVISNNGSMRNLSGTIFEILSALLS